MKEIELLDHATIRSEIDQFSASGWMRYVIECESWWTPKGGGLARVRRQTAAHAYSETRQALHEQFVKSPFLYRTLLLAAEFDRSSLTDSDQDYGRFWTSCPGVATDYIPRRCYQTKHPMPEVGTPWVVKIGPVSSENIDWIATVGCQLSNPGLSEVRLKPDVKMRAIQLFPTYDDDGLRLLRSTPPVAGIMPIPEGPGFPENFKLLNQAEGIRAAPSAA